MSSEKSKDQITVNEFTELMKEFIKYKSEYEKLTKEGSLNKESNLKYKKKLGKYEETLKRTYIDLNIRKN